ncbi:MAG: hypothetical protein ACLUML_02360 [Acutalibacteraceae bacterium]
MRKARKERLERERLALYDGKKQDDIRVPSYLSNYARHPFQGRSNVSTINHYIAIHFNSSEWLNL